MLRLVQVRRSHYTLDLILIIVLVIASIRLGPRLTRHELLLLTLRQLNLQITAHFEKPVALLL